jgi:hypothetical protein
LSFSSIDGSGGPGRRPTAAAPTAPAAPVTQTYGTDPGKLPDPFPHSPSVTFTSPDLIGSFSSPDFVNNYAPESVRNSILTQLAKGGGNVSSSTAGLRTAGTTPPQIDVNSLYQKALANMGFNTLDNSLQKAREQLIARFGDSSLASLAGFGLDPQAAAFAQQNYLSGNSDLSRLDKQRDQQRRAVINRLASHGILFSGDLGYGLNQAEQAYGNSRYDLTNQYLDKLQQLLEQTLQAKQQARQNVANSLISAFGQQVQNPEDLIGLYGG